MCMVYNCNSTIYREELLLLSLQKQSASVEFSMPSTQKKTYRTNFDFYSNILCVCFFFFGRDYSLFALFLLAFLTTIIEINRFFQYHRLISLAQYARVLFNDNNERKKQKTIHKHKRGNIHVSY